MADVKISNLPASTVPLAGTEVLPIVQSGVTKKVANNDLRPKQIQSNATSGVLQVAGPASASTRVMTTPDANFTVARIDAAQSFTGDQTLSTGNLVIGTAGKGIDFTSDPSAAGMTSELFDDYEEGTWTPTIVGSTTPGTQTYTWRKGNYTKVGNRVLIDFELLVTKDATTAGTITITGLPFTANANSGIPLGFEVVAQNGVTFGGSDNTLVINALQGTSVLELVRYPGVSAVVATALAASFRIFGTTHYYV